MLYEFFDGADLTEKFQFTPETSEKVIEKAFVEFINDTGTIYYKNSSQQFKFLYGI